MDRTHLQAAAGSLLEKAEIRATAKATAPPLSDDEINEYGQLFDGLSEPHRTPAFRLLREVRELRKVLGVCQTSTK